MVLTGLHLGGKVKSEYCHMQIEQLMRHLADGCKGDVATAIDNIHAELANLFSGPGVDLLAFEPSAPLLTIEDKPWWLHGVDIPLTRMAALTFAVHRHGKTVFPSDVIPIIDMKGHRDDTSPEIFVLPELAQPTVSPRTTASSLRGVELEKIYPGGRTLEAKRLHVT